MAYTPITWADEVPDTTPIKFAITDDTAGEIAASAQIEMVTAKTAGTPLSAANMNHLELGVSDAHTLVAAASVAAAAAQATADAAIPKNLATVAGDLIYATAAAVWARLAKGSANQQLRMNPGATAPQWGGAIFASVKRTAAQSIASGSTVSISFDTEIDDTDGFWAVGNPTYLTVPYAGVYAVGGLVTWGYSATGTRSVSLLMGSTSHATSLGGSAQGTEQLTCFTARLVAGAKICLQLLQNSGSSLNAYADLWATYVGP